MNSDEQSFGWIGFWQSVLFNKLQDFGDMFFGFLRTGSTGNGISGGGQGYDGHFACPGCAAFPKGAAMAENFSKSAVACEGRPVVSADGIRPDCRREGRDFNLLSHLNSGCLGKPQPQISGRVR